MVTGEKTFPGRKSLEAQMEGALPCWSGASEGQVEKRMRLRTPGGCTCQTFPPEPSNHKVRIIVDAFWDLT
jgi:hypothetical protein